jgi:hypothetical protein
MTPSQTREGNVLPTMGSPTTPSGVPRGTHEIAALSDLVDAMRHSIDFDAQGTIDLEDLEDSDEDDLDADLEDMDEQDFITSFIEDDSMEL